MPTPKLVWPFVTQAVLRCDFAKDELGRFLAGLGIHYSQYFYVFYGHFDATKVKAIQPTSVDMEANSPLLGVGSQLGFHFGGGRVRQQATKQG